MEEKIKEKCIPIGSREWGGFNKESDYDFIVDEKDLENLEKYANNLCIYFKWIDGSSISILNKMHNISNIKFDYDSKTFNLISYNTNDIKKIKKILPLMKGNSLLHRVMIKDKNIRVKIFSTLLDIIIKDF